jgi:hypothetical protein
MTGTVNGYNFERRHTMDTSDQHWLKLAMWFPSLEMVMPDGQRNGRQQIFWVS